MGRVLKNASKAPNFFPIFLAQILGKVFYTLNIPFFYVRNMIAHIQCSIDIIVVFFFHCQTQNSKGINRLTYKKLAFSFDQY